MRFLYEYNHESTFYKFSYKFANIPVLLYWRNQKQELNFQKVCNLVTINISDFSLQWVTLYFKDMPNLIDFYKCISNMLFLLVLQFHDRMWSNSVFTCNISLIQKSTTLFKFSTNLLHSFLIQRFGQKTSTPSLGSLLI